MPDVFEALKDELYGEFGSDSPRSHLNEIVDYLREEGFIDYDNLKEIYLIDEDD